MAKRAKRSRRSSDLEFLNLALSVNAAAVQEGPKKKKWTGHDLNTIKPLTPNQEDLFHAWFNGAHICAHGSAGTGKSFLSLFLALTSVIDRGEQNRIIIVRSAVPTRDIGFLPGDLDEKTQFFEVAYDYMCYELVGKPSTYADMKQAGIIEFMTTSFIRGLTWDNAVIIVEEAQNMTFHELNSIMTRVGTNSRVIVNGDLKQTDLQDTKKTHNVCGLGKFLQVIRNMNEFTSIEFTRDDIVRSEFVKSWIIATEDVDQRR